MTTLSHNKKEKSVDTAVSQITRRPTIGIVGHLLGPNSAGITLPYLRYFENFGNVKLIMPTSKEIDTTLDLLVVPGGPDIEPSRYLKANEKVSWFNQKPDPMREYFDVCILPKYIEKKIPIFGINYMSHCTVMCN